jgi:antirestriction protein ArdC
LGVSEEYAEEELVAELGSAFLCSQLQVPVSVREDHAAYINVWVKVLKEDKRAIFKASALAAKAADYLREKVGQTLAPF